jgi:hypothetical protein
MSMATVALKALYHRSFKPRMSPRQSVDVFWLFCFSVSGRISGPLGGVNWTSGHSGWAVARSSVQLQDLWGFASAEGPPRGAGDDAASTVPRSAGAIAQLQVMFGWWWAQLAANSGNAHIAVEMIFLLSCVLGFLLWSVLILGQRFIRKDPWKVSQHAANHYSG